MAVLDIACKNWLKFKVTTPEWVATDDSTILLLRKSILVLHSVVLVDKVLVEAETLPFSYEIRLQDGRQWFQTFTERSTNPGMTFNVVNAWRLSEFEPHRRVRDAIILCLVELNASHIEARPRT